MNELDRVLQENGIRRSPNPTLEGLFRAFGSIFAQSEGNMSIINLNTGVVCKFNPDGGRIHVTTDHEKNFLPHREMFNPIKNKTDE